MLGVIYDRAEIKADELTIHTVRELADTIPVDVAEALKDREYTSQTLRDIPSVVRNLQFFAQPKYRIAIDRPGSGNTKNIGSVGIISHLVEGTGPFSNFG